MLPVVHMFIIYNTFAFNTANSIACAEANPAKAVKFLGRMSSQ